MTYLVFGRRFLIQLPPYTAAHSRQRTLERAFASPKLQKHIWPPAHLTLNHNMKHCWPPDGHAGIQASESDTTELATKHTFGCPMKTKRPQSTVAGNQSL